MVLLLPEPCWLPSEGITSEEDFIQVVLQTSEWQRERVGSGPGFEVSSILVCSITCSDNCFIHLGCAFREVEELPLPGHTLKIRSSYGKHKNLWLYLKICRILTLKKVGSPQSFFNSFGGCKKKKIVSTMVHIVRLASDNATTAWSSLGNRV